MNEEGMKRTVSPALMAGVIAVVIAIVAFFGYKTLAPDNSGVVDQAEAIKMNSSTASSTYSSQLQSRPNQGYGGGNSYQNASQQYSQQMQQGRR